MTRVTELIGRRLDKAIAIEVMQYEGIGYYGPDGNSGKHIDQQFFGNDKAAAIAAYEEHWPKVLELTEPSLCRWQEGWGPIFIPEWHASEFEAVKLAENLRANKDISWQILSPNRNTSRWVGKIIRDFYMPLQTEAVRVRGSCFAEALSRAVLQWHRQYETSES
jgi:hypothetical protein